MNISKCRRETAETALGLEPSLRLPRVLALPDDVTWSWLTGRCALCGACAEMLRLFDVSPEDARKARLAARPKLRLVA